MAGIFGVVRKDMGECIEDLFYGTDYHSHLGTVNGGLAVQKADNTYVRSIHDISNAQFKSKMEPELERMRGCQMGLGVISDHDSQPLIVHSHLGQFSIVTANKIANLEQIIGIFDSGREHLLERSGNEANSTEIIAALISKGTDYPRGIELAQDIIEGSCSVLLLAKEGIYAARDRLGRTPLIIGEKDNAYAVTFETTAFPNLDYKKVRDLGPGEIVLVTPNGIEQKKKPGKDMQICSFLWVYYGYPSSNYEGINVERTRKRCGAELANADIEDIKKGKYKMDLVAGIPDSGTSHGLGYANQAKIAFERPFVKYTPTWPRSFMPQNQEMRKLVAKMKLVPIPEIIAGQSLLFCEDSIVRGTQLRDTVQRLFDYGAREVHMRPACPPLIHGCKFLNFSRSKSPSELVGQRAIRALNGIREDEPIPEKLLESYHDESSQRYEGMVDWIRRDLRLTTLKYQKLPNLVRAIGLPKEKLCTYCWDGCEGCGRK